MSGTYKIIKKADGGTKFAAYVKFNEAIDTDFYSAEQYPEGGEYWECESTDSTEIATALQATADADAAQWAETAKKEAEAGKVTIKNGQIVL